VKYLVDSNVLSEPTKPDPEPGVVDWLRRKEKQIAVSPIILGELEYGILLLPAGPKRRKLQAWFSAGVHRLRILDFDAATASAWARLLAGLKKKGQAMPVKDSLIAATALAHNLTVATRSLTNCLLREKLLEARPPYNIRRL
jgi:predicted nucleic acid-binding protein